MGVMNNVKPYIQIGNKLGKGLIILLVLTVLFVWLLNTPSGLLGKADAIGYAVCHRIDTRSFHLGERQIPLCARCSGMFLGALLGLVYSAGIGWKRTGNPPKKVLFIMGVFVIAFIVDGLNSYLHLPFFTGVPTLYEPSNSLRLITGTGMGLMIAVLLYPSFNQTVWADGKPEPAIKNLKLLGLLIFLALLLDLLILTENTIVLYPLSILSALSVVLLLTMVYTMIWLIVFRSEKRRVRSGQLLIPLIAGFGVAILQIGLMDFVRYALTGTWEGFHILL